jgi:PadR family transcriptional regulator, regulatory protein AphA
MSMRHAILGLLSWKPASGYDLKKNISTSACMPWSGNNNQIYKALLELHRDGRVIADVVHPESGPSKKVYSVTPAGVEELKAWLQSTPEPPELRGMFLIQLSWADLLGRRELDDLVLHYEEQIRLQLLMAEEEARRNAGPQRTPREAFLWEMIGKNRPALLKAELAWVQRLRNGLAAPGRRN